MSRLKTLTEGETPFSTYVEHLRIQTNEGFLLNTAFMKYVYLNKKSTEGSRLMAFKNTKFLL